MLSIKNARALPMVLYAIVTIQRTWGYRIFLPDRDKMSTRNNTQIRPYRNKKINFLCPSNTMQLLSCVIVTYATDSLPNSSKRQPGKVRKWEAAPTIITLLPPPAADIVKPGGMSTATAAVDTLLMRGALVCKRVAWTRSMVSKKLLELNMKWN